MTTPEEIDLPPERTGVDLGAFLEEQAVDPLPWEIDEQSFDAAEHTAADRHLDEQRAEAYATEPSRVPAIFHAVTLHDLLAVRDAAEIATGGKALRDELVATVRQIVDEQIRTLPAEPPTSSTELRPQATRLADLADLLETVAGAFSAAAKEAKGATGELVTVLGHPIRVGDGYGSDLRVTLEQRRELSVDHAVVDDVLVAAALPPADVPGVSYLHGYRAGIVALRALLSSSPTYRSTALDALVGDLEDRGLDDLALRLGKAYGKIDKGEPTVKIERLEPKGKRA